MKQVPNIFFSSFCLLRQDKWITSNSMDNFENTLAVKCDVCGGNSNQIKQRFKCSFCGFEKQLGQIGLKNNKELIFVSDINKYFRDKHNNLEKGDTFELVVSVSRFYRSPQPIPGQINFFKSKNIMFLLEQNGFQFINRRSRFSNTLNLTVRKI